MDPNTKYLSSYSPVGDIISAQPCESIHQQNLIFIFHVFDRSSAPKRKHVPSKSENRCINHALTFLWRNKQRTRSRYCCPRALRIHHVRVSWMLKRHHRHRFQTSSSLPQEPPRTWDLREEINHGKDTGGQPKLPADFSNWVSLRLNYNKGSTSPAHIDRSVIYLYTNLTMMIIQNRDREQTIVPQKVKASICTALLWGDAVRSLDLRDQKLR